MADQTPIEKYVSENISKIAFAVGFNASDRDALGFLTSLTYSAIADMQGAGVKEVVLITNKLTFITLCQFIKDNLNYTPGTTKFSEIYIANVQKLKLMNPPDQNDGG